MATELSKLTQNSTNKISVINNCEKPARTGREPSAAF